MLVCILFATSVFSVQLKEEPFEITERDRLRAEELFRYPLRQDRSVIISMRWWNLDEQISHFLFGAGIAYALNRSILVEMRRYPLFQTQPKLQFQLNGITPEQINPPAFTRLRVAREFFCKSEVELEGNSSDPLLIRNFDDISSLYGNHFIAKRLKSLFGMHAGYFLLHHYVQLPEVFEEGEFLGVEIHSFETAKKAAHMQDPALITGNFSAAVETLRSVRVCAMSNDPRVVEKMEQIKVLPNDISGFAQLVRAKYFIGTYRSRMSNLVNMMRGRKGMMLNTDTGHILEMSNYQAGVLSPYEQNVEELEFTVNEKLRGCSDNIEELREVLHHFVL